MSKIITISVLLLALLSCAKANTNQSNILIPAADASNHQIIASPNGEIKSIILNGRPTEFDILRSYFSAAGTECKDVIIHELSHKQKKHICNDGSGWFFMRDIVNYVGHE